LGAGPPPGGFLPFDPHHPPHQEASLPIDPFDADTPDWTPPPGEEYGPDPADDDTRRCPAPNCSGGDVSLTEYRQDDGTIIFGGPCDICAQESVKCPECEALTWLFDGDPKQCDGCDAVYQRELGKHGMTSEFLRVR
jgi:hypothetical protein